MGTKSMFNPGQVFAYGGTIQLLNYSPHPAPPFLVWYPSSHCCCLQQQKTLFRQVFEAHCSHNNGKRDRAKAPCCDWCVIQPKVTYYKKFSWNNAHSWSSFANVNTSTFTAISSLSTGGLSALLLLLRPPWQSTLGDFCGWLSCNTDFQLY